jgi:hypothetical protein
MRFTAESPAWLKIERVGEVVAEDFFDGACACVFEQGEAGGHAVHADVVGGGEDHAVEHAIGREVAHPVLIVACHGHVTLMLFRESCMAWSGVVEAVGDDEVFCEYAGRLVHVCHCAGAELASYGVDFDPLPR